VAANVRVKLARAELQKAAQQGAGKLVARATRQTLNRGRVLSPWDTGNMRASHTMDIRVLKASRVIGRVTTRVKYAMAVHEGAQPHIIRPRKKKALKFKVGGRTVIVRSVRHPGNKGRPWLRQAMTEVAHQRGFTVRRVGPGAQ
jgi:hypothetical protein